MSSRRFEEWGLLVMVVSMMLLAVATRSMVHFVLYLAMFAAGAVLQLVLRRRSGVARRAHERAVEVRRDQRRRRRILASRAKRRRARS